MEAAVYLLCAVTSLACAILLLRGYWRGRDKLLLWSGLCFLGLTLDNVTLFLDLFVLPAVDLSLFRKGGTLAGLLLLIYGLIWNTER